jgi:hypothetical protein
VAWYSFGGFLGNVVAGLIVLGIGYFVVERSLHLRERVERDEGAETQRRVNRRVVLTVVLAEFESNAAKLTTALEELPNEDQRLIYPLFDISMWPLVSSPEIFTTLESKTAEALTHAYNRMATSNEANATLLDLHQGRTAILVATAVAPAFDDPRVAEIYGKYLGYRADLRTSLLDRLADLKPHIDNAIDAVEHELGKPADASAATRTYRPEHPPRFPGE